MSRHHSHRSSQVAESGSKPMTARQRPTEDQVRCLAYEKFCKRNGSPGDPVTDWLEAERELAEQGGATSASDH